MPGEIPPDQVLSCGCLLRCSVIEGVNTLTVVPCRAGCTNYEDVMGLAAKKDVPVTYRPAP